MGIELEHAGAKGSCRDSWGAVAESGPVHVRPGHTRRDGSRRASEETYGILKLIVVHPGRALEMLRRQPLTPTPCRR